MSVLILAGLVSFIPAQYAAAVPTTATFTFSCAPGVMATLTGITITKDGNPIGSIPGPISCPPTTTGTVGLSESGANDLRVNQVSMTKDGVPFGPSACSIAPPADLEAGVSFDADIVTGGVICTSPPPGTDALFVLVEAPATPVGGELAGIDATALFVAAAFTNAYWALPAVVAAIIGLGIFRMKREN